MADDEGSEGSYHSDHYADRFPELVGKQAPLYKQASCFHGFKRMTMADQTEFEEAYPGALEAVRGLNPEIFQTYYGTQVVNIKTEFVENVHHAVQEKVWTTLEPISKRIMKVWAARRESSEKVLFLFSINGQKQYCGLAEMCGPWDPETLTEGWTDPSHGFKGTFPLTWIYVKNVPYARFAELKHGEKNQPIANMWSGQTISPSEPLGREVIQIYITAPHASNILAWPRAQGGPLGAPRSVSVNMHPHHNVRATRGGHAGQHGRAGGKATDSNWRAIENSQPTVGHIIGEIDANQPASIAARRSAAVLTINSAPLPQTDGAFESATTARPGQILSFVVNETGALVPVSPEHPQTANPMKHMPDSEYFNRFGQQTRSVEDFRGSGRVNGRGGYHGGMRGGMRNGGAPIIHNHFYGSSEKQVGLGINDYQSELYHADSNATIKSQQPHGPSTASGSSLKHAAFAAEFVPMSEANRSLTQTAAAKKAGAQTQRGHQIHHAASNMSFMSQQQHFPPTNTSFASHVPQSQQVRHMASNVSFAPNVQVIDPTSDAGMDMQAAPHLGQPYVKHSQQSSQDSYPSHFRSADSMAGYVRPAKYQAQRIPHAQPGPAVPRVRNLGEKTPTHLPKTADLHQKTEDWIEKTPRNNVSAPTAIDGAAVPVENRAQYYYLMADKIEIEQKLAGMSIEVDAAEYYRTMAKKAEVERVISRLAIGKHEMLEGYSMGGGSHGSSVVASSSASSFNVRAEDGRTLPSVSEAGKRGRRAAKHNKLGSWDARVLGMAEEVLASPPDSIKTEHHGSPMDSMVGTEVTNPFSEGDGLGGIRLE